MTEISKTQDAIARITAAIAAIPVPGRSRAEREASVRTFVARAAEDGARQIRYEVGSGNLTGVLNLKPGRNGEIDLMPRIAAMIGVDRLADVLIEFLPDDEAAPDPAERARLEAELLDLGHREEDLVEAAEARGEAVQRRPDADPAIVLRVKAAP